MRFAGITLGVDHDNTACAQPATLEAFFVGGMAYART